MNVPQRWKWKTKKIMIPSPFPAILRKDPQDSAIKENTDRKRKKERKKKIRLEHKPN